MNPGQELARQAQELEARLSSLRGEAGEVRKELKRVMRRLVLAAATGTDPEARPLLDYIEAAPAQAPTPVASGKVAPPKPAEEAPPRRGRKRRAAS